MNETVVFRNELGGYSTPYDKDTLAKLYYELQKENERLTAENAKIDEYKCVIDDISEQCRELEAENVKLRARLQNAVELPCKVGDTVYWIDGNEIYEYAVQGFDIGKSKEALRIILDGMWLCPVFEFFKDNALFFDRDKAEAKLKELQGGNAE